VSSIRMRRLTEWSLGAEGDPGLRRRSGRGSRAACLPSIWRHIGYKDEYPGVCLYMGQTVRIFCDKDRKDE